MGLSATGAVSFSNFQGAESSEIRSLAIVPLKRNRDGIFRLGPDVESQLVYCAAKIACIQVIDSKSQRSRITDRCLSKCLVEDSLHSFPKKRNFARLQIPLRSGESFDNFRKNTDRLQYRHRFCHKNKLGRCCTFVLA